MQILLIKHNDTVNIHKPNTQPKRQELPIICIYLYVFPLSYPYDSFLRDTTILNFVFGLFSKMSSVINIEYSRIICVVLVLGRALKWHYTIYYLLRLAFFTHYAFKIYCYGYICIFYVLLYNNQLCDYISLMKNFIFTRFLLFCRMLLSIFVYISWCTYTKLYHRYYHRNGISGL